MKKLFSSKKGINDISIAAVLIFIFIGAGLVLPFVNAEFGTGTGSSFDTNEVSNQLIAQEQEDVKNIGVGQILTSIGKMFFWTFGELPFWLDGIFVVLRILFLAILIRNFVPFIGGSG